MGGRDQYEAWYHQQFEKDLKNLGVLISGRILAELQVFMADWKSNVPFAELKSNWQYKQVGRVKGYAIMQIRVIGSYRLALLSISRPDPRVWFLHAYPRQTTNQEEIERAKARALSILEQYQL